jgi:CspA family cold shock protein
MSDANGRDYGQIIFWSNDRHYGFLRPDSGERDIFVHGSAFPGGEREGVRIGDRISYTVGADRRPGREARTCAVDARIEVGDRKPAGLFAPPTFGDSV